MRLQLFAMNLLSQSNFAKVHYTYCQVRLAVCIKKDWEQKIKNQIFASLWKVTVAMKVETFRFFSRFPAIKAYLVQIFKCKKYLPENCSSLIQFF